MSQKCLAIGALMVGAILPISAALAQSFTTLYGFAGGADGATPFGGLVYQGGLLYGTTSVGGGAGNYGTIYTVDPTTGAENIFSNFGADGLRPMSSLVYQAGFFYGATLQGGPNSVGAAFAVDASTGIGTTLHNFDYGPTDGTSPGAPIYASGTLYGTTYQGGTSAGTGCDRMGCGIVYAINATTGAETVLYNFTGAADGGNPGNVIGGSPLVYESGTLYGTAFAGGKKFKRGGNGVIFAVNATSGAETVLYKFKGGADGANPSGPVIYQSGILYGTTEGGGTAGDGTVFSFNVAKHHKTTLYSFTGGNDGKSPNAGLVYQSGTLYGMTPYGGSTNCSEGCGALFAVNATTGAETTLYTFGGMTDGGVPMGGLIYQAGTLYGTASRGGALGFGTVYALTP